MPSTADFPTSRSEKQKNKADHGDQDSQRPKDGDACNETDQHQDYTKNNHGSTSV
jgi:hypothetical protein